MVFALSFITTQDLRSPMHFPFLLGYTFMLSVPVSSEDLPVRILALVTGSVFIVALNVMVNRKRHSSTCHRSISAMCSEVSACCERVLSTGESSSEQLDTLCLRLRGTMYDRLRKSFFTTPGDRRVLDMAASLQMAGRAVCQRERDGDVLRALKSLMDCLMVHENGKTDPSGFLAAAEGFLSDHPDADGVITASVVSLRDCLTSLSDDGRGQRTDLGDRMRAVAKESFRTDSARFTFAVRMSVVFTVFAFVWQYWDLENAKWLLFTTVALVLPYVDNAWRKSAMRLTGTVAGVAVFAVVLALVGGDVGMLSVSLLVANYVYTVLDPKRYDVMMVFITFFLSAVLDNLTTSLVMIAVLRKLVPDHKDRMIYAAMVILAANAGGAFSPIGDVTTIILGIMGANTSLGVIKEVFIPSVVSVVIPTF